MLLAKTRFMSIGDPSKSYQGEKTYSFYGCTNPYEHVGSIIDLAVKSTPEVDQSHARLTRS